MSGFLCDEYPVGATIYAHFHSFDSNGASITLTGLAAIDVEIYKNGSVTQRASDAGYTLLDTDGIDFDGITGIHGISIDLNDNTDSGFFASGSQYTVVLSAVTIDTRTVNLVLGSFRISPAEANVAAIKVVTDQLVTAHTEPSGVPAADETPLDKLGYLFMALRNRVDVTATKKTFYDDGGAAEFEKDLSDDGTTYSESESNAI